MKRWPSLIRYAETGHLAIDNNPVENTIRPIALGKKNWLFAGSERVDQRAAAIQTLPDIIGNLRTGAESGTYHFTFSRKEITDETNKTKQIIR